MPVNRDSWWTAQFGRSTPKQIALKWLMGDLYFHERFADAFASAGFEVRSVRKHWFHDIFEARLWRGSAELDKNDVRAVRQIHRLLKCFGFLIPVDEIQVIQRRESLRIIFVFEYGKVGVKSWA